MNFNNMVMLILIIIMHLLTNVLTVFIFIFQVAMAGDYILAVTSMMIARLNHNDVTITLSQVRVILLMLILNQT